MTDKVSPPKITAYITRYALTAGIKAVEGNVCNPGGNEFFQWRGAPGEFMQYAHGNDWHLTKEAAVKRAEEMRVKKIASVEKQLAKLKKLAF